ncbi:hypothetical protein QE152_g5301 [Popillia japonica]|uniref:Uncharacterized protein n=1 Tax=Popillia japonica TaxID=7064 RepID=A0AAW1MQP4_POPJA
MYETAEYSTSVLMFLVQFGGGFDREDRKRSSTSHNRLAHYVVCIVFALLNLLRVLDRDSLVPYPLEPIRKRIMESTMRDRIKIST